jgi:hypothetical protein
MKKTSRAKKRPANEISTTRDNDDDEHKQDQKQDTVPDQTIELDIEDLDKIVVENQDSDNDDNVDDEITSDLLKTAPKKTFRKRKQVLSPTSITESQDPLDFFEI